MRRAAASVLPFALLASLVSPPPARAAWPHDPTTNRLVCTGAGPQFNPQVVSDGAGGSIVVFVDRRQVTQIDTYAQRVNASGELLWDPNGMPVCTHVADQSSAVVAVPDGAGGVIVGWIDYRANAGDIYAQRLNASGAPQWTLDGVVVSTATGEPGYLRAAADGSGGAVFAWSDPRGATGFDIYAQRVNSSGTSLWAANGVGLCLATLDQTFPALDYDPVNGATIVWQDNRNSATTGLDIYAGRINPSGSAVWAANGVVVCNASSFQQVPCIVAGAAGSVITAWSDQRNGNLDVFAQSLASGNGASQWVANGISVAATPETQSGPLGCSDESGGAILMWTDSRLAPSSGDVYGQRLSSAGASLWVPNGWPIVTVGGDQALWFVRADGAGGAVALFSDNRLPGSGTDLFATRVNGSGGAPWGATGVAVTTAPNNQTTPAFDVQPDGGVVVAWRDERGGAGVAETYAQKVDRWGYLGAEPVIASVTDVANDQGGRVKVSWYASPLDVDPDFENVRQYLIFRSVPAGIAEQARREGRITTDAARIGAGGPDGMLLSADFGTSSYFWEYVGTQAAFHIGAYSFVASTTADSVAGSNPRTAFMVQARDSAGTKWWYSNPDSGYSVDDLAPAAPAPFSGQYQGAITRLHWGRNGEPDLDGYRLYRGASPGFVPGPANRIATVADTGYVDPAGQPQVYKLTAVDVHGNESPVATLIPSGTLDAPGTAPSGLSIAAAPNPARRGEHAVLRFTIPRPGRVALAVFDQQGRRVRSLAAGSRDAGEHVVRWDGRDEAGRHVPGGVFFARLEHEQRSIVGRIVRIR